MGSKRTWCALQVLAVFIALCGIAVAGPGGKVTPGGGSSITDFASFKQGWSNNVMLVHRSSGRCLGLDGNGQVALGDCKGPQRMRVSLVDISNGFVAVSFDGASLCLDSSSGRAMTSAAACGGVVRMSLIPSTDGATVAIASVDASGQGSKCLQAPAGSFNSECSPDSPDQAFQVCKNQNQCVSLGPALAAEQVKLGGGFKPKGYCKKLLRAMGNSNKQNKYAKPGKMKKVTIDPAAFVGCNAVGLTLPDGVTEVTLNMQKVEEEESAWRGMSESRQCNDKGECMTIRPDSSECYAGNVDGDVDSLAVFCKYKGHTAGSVSSQAFGNIVLDSTSVPGESDLYEQDDVALSRDSKDPPPSSDSLRAPGRRLQGAPASSQMHPSHESDLTSQGRRLQQTIVRDVHSYIYINVYVTDTATYPGLRAAVDAAITRTNSAFARASVSSRLKLLRFEQVTSAAYVRTNMLTTLSAFIAGRPGSVTQYGADLYMLLVPNLLSGDPGVGILTARADFQLIPTIPGKSPFVLGATVLKVGQVGTTLFSHNIGHNLGLPHNKEDTTITTVLLDVNSYAPWNIQAGHCGAYLNGVCTQWHNTKGGQTIMAVGNTCSNVAGAAGCAILNDWGNYNPATGASQIVQVPYTLPVVHNHPLPFGSPVLNPGGALRQAHPIATNFARHGCDWWSGLYLPFASGLQPDSTGSPASCWYLTRQACTDYCQGNGIYTGATRLFNQVCTGVEYYARTGICCFKSKRTGYLDWLEFAEGTLDPVKFPWGPPEGKLRC